MSLHSKKPDIAAPLTGTEHGHGNATEWQPHTITATETIEEGPTAALSALFDDGIPAPATGDQLPPLWHWVALARWPVSSELGTDGHPARGSFLPPVELERRMFAGGEVTFHQPLSVGAVVRREDTVVSVTAKTGRSGPLVLVIVATRLYDEHGRLAIEETQNLIYRTANTESTSDLSPESATDTQTGGGPLRRTDVWTWDFATDPTLLMRFSAATANPHRIHYDWPYATRIEGYPGLVVHGPLMTLALAEMLRLEQHPRTVSRMTHRSRMPLFCGQRAQLRRTQQTTDGALTLALFGPNDSGPHSTVTVEFDTNRDSTPHM